MADSNAVHSYGSTLTVSATSGGSYTAVAEVLNYKWNGKVGSSNVTHLTSDAATMEKKPKMRDPGSLTASLNFTKAQFATLFGYHIARTQVFWKINAADGSVLGPFKGHISDMSLDVPDDERITDDITIDITGDGDAFTPAA